MKTLLLASLFLLGCPHPVPSGVSPGLIDCSLQAVRDYGIPLIPKVNSCITGQDWQSCLIGLVSPVANITEDVLACVVQSSGKSYAASAAANPKDAISADGAARAKQFVTERNYKFKGE
jgi:hypothetical protein